MFRRKTPSSGLSTLCQIYKLFTAYLVSIFFLRIRDPFAFTFTDSRRFFLMNEIKTDQFILYGAEIVVCSHINTKHINTVRAERTVLEC
jgi:hypothetical protein